MSWDPPNPKPSKARTKTSPKNNPKKHTKTKTKPKEGIGDAFQNPNPIKTKNTNQNNKKRPPQKKTKKQKIACCEDMPFVVCFNFLETQKARENTMKNGIYANHKNPNIGPNKRSACFWEMYVLFSETRIFS